MARPPAHADRRGRPRRKRRVQAAAARPQSKTRRRPGRRRAAPAGRARPRLLARARPKAPRAPRPPIARRRIARRARAHDAVRQTIAKRLKEAQDTAAMLTTFNDVDMSAVMELRRDYRDAVREEARGQARAHGLLRQGRVQALKDIPAVNAEIDGDRHRLQELLPYRRCRRHRARPVVPVLRDADRMSLAEIETAIADFGARAREGKLGTGGDARRHLHHLQWRHLWLAALDPDPERAAIRYSRHAPHRGACRGARRADRGAADDVSRALLRSSPRRRQRGRHLPGRIKEASRTRSASCSTSSDDAGTQRAGHC